MEPRQPCDPSPPTSRLTHDRYIEHSDIISPLIGQESNHPPTKSLDLLKRGVVRHIERKRLRHFWASAEVNEELGVQYGVRGLNQCVVPVQENGAEESDFLDGVHILIDLDPVTNIIGVFNEQEDDAGQDFCETSADEPTKACQVSAMRFCSERDGITYQG